MLDSPNNAKNYFRFRIDATQAFLEELQNQRESMQKVSLLYVHEPPPIAKLNFFCTLFFWLNRQTA